MILCVVLTGRPSLVASVKYKEDEITAQVIPSMRTAGSCSKYLVEMILVRMVSATRAPTAIEPVNSMAEAIIIACIIVREREETEVAKELATSLAPAIYN